MNQTTTLILVRHAESTWNMEDRIQGLQDSPLTPFGILQAKETANRLSHERIDTVVSSPLGRAHHTAEILCASILSMRGRAIVTCGDLSEQNYGILTGMTTREIAARRLLPRWRWQRCLYHIPCGESLLAKRRKVMTSLQQLIREHSGENILIVSHSGPIRIIVGRLLRRSLLWTLDFHPMPCALTVLTHRDHHWEADALNDASHLDCLRRFFQRK